MNRADRDRIVLKNLPLVGYLVSQVSAKAKHFDRDDLASVGTLALITCAESYDPARGVPFSAYARHRILGAFTDEMRNNDWASRTTRRRITDVTTVQDTLTNTLGRSPSKDEIASALGVDRESVESALADADRTVTVLDDAAANLLLALSPSPEESLLVQEQIAFVHAAVESLPERIRYVISQVYLEERSVNDLADELGSTHSAVSQVRSEGIRLLRDAMQAHYDTETVADAPGQRRISQNRRAAFLAKVAENTLGGVTRRPVPALAGAF